MKKITFENLPSTNTPINSANLNQVQDNVEALFEGNESMGEIVVEDVVCKNLFNKNTLRQYYWLDDATGLPKLTSNFNNMLTEYIEVQPNTDYIVSGFITNQYFMIGSYNSSKTFNGFIAESQGSGGKNFQFKTSSNDKYILIAFNDGTTNPNLQVEKGNEATNYTSHKKFSYNSTDSMGKIVVDDIRSKNDFPLLNDFNSTGIKITSNGDGTYNISGTATANVECVLFKNIEDTIIENGSTYTLSASQSLPTGVNSRIEFYNNTSYVRGFLTVINTASNNPTAAANTTGVNRVRFGLFVTSGTTVNITNLGLQLEKGSVATNYVGHKEFDNSNLKGKCLWKNSKPTEAMAYQYGGITLSSSDYDVLEFYFYTGTDNKLMTVQKTMAGYGVVGMYINGYGGLVYGRNISYVSKTSYTINECYRYGSGATTPPAGANTFLIPAYVIGYKNSIGTNPTTSTASVEE